MEKKEPNREKTYTGRLLLKAVKQKIFGKAPGKGIIPPNDRVERYRKSRSGKFNSAESSRTKLANKNKEALQKEWNKKNIIEEYGEKKRDESIRPILLIVEYAKSLFTFFENRAKNDP